MFFEKNIPERGENRSQITPIPSSHYGYSYLRDIFSPNLFISECIHIVSIIDNILCSTFSKFNTVFAQFDT